MPRLFPRHGRLSCLVGLFLLSLLGTGCFHKDVMTDTADDVEATLLYQGQEGTLVISKENVFQATSKESGGGVTHISGYTEVRLSSYDVATGELKGRVELGDMIDDACTLLGSSPGKVWMFSIDPEIGLHYRDPRTLEVKEAWPQLSQKPGLGSFKAAKPDWPVISQYFVFDHVRERLLLTDEAGYKYALDPEKFTLAKVEEEMPRVEWDETVLSTSGQFIRDQYISLDGDARKSIAFGGKRTGSDLSFLFGEWLLDASPAGEGRRMRDYRSQTDSRLRFLQDSIAILSTTYPDVVPHLDWRNSDPVKSRIYQRYDAMKREVDDLERELKSLDGPFEKVLSQPILTPDGKRGFILHANIVADTAHCIVSCVELQPDSTWRKHWDTDLMGIYRDTNKADNAGAFETVYSKGNPEFDYNWAGTDGRHLVLIRQLHMIGIDVETGKLLWNNEI